MIKKYLLTVFLIGCLVACKEDEGSPVGEPGNKLGSLSVNLTSSTKASDSQGNEYNVGWQTGGYQDPYVQKKAANGNVIWKLIYETTNVDGRAVLVFVDDADQPWVVFTVDGGDNTSNYINKKNIEDGAFSGVYSNGYGSGGGSVVTVLARINPSTGKIIKGTFIAARKNDGKTNSLHITKIGKKNGNLAFDVSSVAWPPAKGKSYLKFPNISDDDRIDNTFFMYYEMNTDLTEIVEAELYKK